MPPVGDKAVAGGEPESIVAGDGEAVDVGGAEAELDLAGGAPVGDGVNRAKQAESLTGGRPLTRTRGPVDTAVCGPRSALAPGLVSSAEPVSRVTGPRVCASEGLGQVPA